jgi:Zn-finger nucleic acid-binding protein
VAVYECSRPVKVPYPHSTHPNGPVRPVGRLRGCEPGTRTLALPARPGYNRAMLCPNDQTEMHPVTVASHYGQTITLDQCGECGGVWFDESEMFRAGQGEARRIEQLDAEKLRSPTAIQEVTRLCPRDGAALFRFADKHFPDNIILERCPSCRGIWLNQGDFTRYQDARRPRLTPPPEVIIGDDGLPTGVTGILAAGDSPNRDNVVGRLGTFLSMPLDERTLQPLESNADQAGAANAVASTLSVLMTLLRIFVIR